MRLNLDPHPFARGGSWAILSVSVMHIYQAVLVHFQPVAIRATDLTSTMIVLRLVDGQEDVLQLTLFVSAVLALFGALFRIGWIRLIVFIPQNLVLGAMAFGGVLAATRGCYLDETPMSWAHISADQVGYLALYSVHASAILRRCWDPNG